MPKATTNEGGDLGLVLLFLRRGQGWSQAALGKAARVNPNLINDYEKGRRALSRERLEHLISFMALPPETIDGTLERLAANRAAGFAAAVAGTLTPSQLRVEAVAAKVGHLAAEFSRQALASLAVEAGAIQARNDAARFWTRLEPLPANERRAVIEASPKPHTWAITELLCAKSIEAAPGSPAEALELADLALLAAERCAGDVWLGKRTQGYAWFHVANARRAANGLPASAAALETAIRLWEAGAPGDPGLFDPTWAYWIEATIRKSQRRFPEALKRIREALAADQGPLRGRLLLTKAQILQSRGEIEASTEVLREAIPCIDEERDPRTALGVRCQFLLNLCLQDRAAEAALHLPGVETLAGELGNEVDLVRVSALGALIASGIGRAGEAEEGFESARRRFADFRPPLAFDYSLVSLDLGLLLLEQGRLAEVRILANQMGWIFSSQEVQREALAALKLFCDAAKEETATVDFARRVIRFLHRSQHDPELKFEEAESA